MSTSPTHDHSRFAPDGARERTLGQGDDAASSPSTSTVGAAGGPPPSSAPLAPDGTRCSRWLAPLAAVLILAALGVAGWAVLSWRARQAPERTLRRLAAAVQARDTAIVERLVDLPALSKQVVDEAITVVKVGSLRDGDSGFGIAVGGETLDKMAPTVARSFELSLRESIGEGADSAAAHIPAALSPLVRLSQGLGGALAVHDLSDGADDRLAPTGDGVDWLGFGETRWRGDTALVPFTVRDRDLPKPVTLTARLVRRDEGWVLLALDRIGDVLMNIEKQRDAIIAAHNAQVDTLLASLVDVGTVRRSVNSDGWGIRTFVRLTAPITNRSDTPLETVFFRARLSGGELSDDITFVRLDDDEPLAPGKTGTITDIIDYNPYIEWHRTVRYGSGSTIVPELVLAVRLTQAGSDTVARVGGWREYEDRVLKRR